ncbi:extensin, partial [Streptomyces sp. NPDC127079]
MADEQYTWLNGETAERLLRGESLEAVDESARDQAERLAARLGALSARATAADTELPGEEAAVAAFRKARESAEEERTDAWRPGAAGQGVDAGLFRLGGGGGGGGPPPRAPTPNKHRPPGRAG